MVDEYIKRSDAINDIFDQQISNNLTETDKVFNTGLRRAMSRVTNLPAADVVPVVRCADCKWFQINIRKDGYLPNGVPECECRHWCGPCDPTDFCSYGARMDLVTDCDQVKDGDEKRDTRIMMNTKNAGR